MPTLWLAVLPGLRPTCPARHVRAHSAHCWRAAHPAPFQLHPLLPGMPRPNPRRHHLDVGERLRHGLLHASVQLAGGWLPQGRAPRHVGGCRHCAGTGEGAVGSPSSKGRQLSCSLLPVAVHEAVHNQPAWRAAGRKRPGCHPAAAALLGAPVHRRGWGFGLHSHRWMLAVTL